MILRVAVARRILHALRLWIVVAGRIGMILRVAVARRVLHELRRSSLHNRMVAVIQLFGKVLWLWGRNSHFKITNVLVRLSKTFNCGFAFFKVHMTMQSIFIFRCVERTKYCFDL